MEATIEASPAAIAAAAAEALQPLQVGGRMDPGKLLVRRLGQVRTRSQAGECDGAEARGEPLGAFRVVRAPVVAISGSSDRIAA